MYKNRAFLIPVFLLILAMLACGSQPAGTPVPNLAASAVAQTVTALLVPGNTATNTPVPATVNPATDTPIPATLAAPTDTAVGSPTQVCDQAQFISETIPDGTSEPPTGGFTKTWRLKNTGACTWTTSYAVVFQSGITLGAPSAIAFTGNVPPGQEVDVSANMEAPAATGEYTSTWTLRNAAGVLFGLGPSNGPFWVKIKVVCPAQPCPGRP